jgi:hypothetical protein
MSVELFDTSSLAPGRPGSRRVLPGPASDGRWEHRKLPVSPKTCQLRRTRRVRRRIYGCASQGDDHPAPHPRNVP